MTPAGYPYAERIRSARGSFLREILGVAQRPGMISFAGGLPSPALFDTVGVRDAMNEAMDLDPTGALQYGPTDGLPALRERTAALVRARGGLAGPDDVVVTTGSQQGIDLLARVLLDPGDTVVLERPAYLAAIQTFGMHEARFRTVAVDADGANVDDLERVLLEVRPKLVYLVPTFGNPSGATLSLARRRRVLELAVEHEVLIVEDDPYGELRFTDEALPPLLALADTVPGASRWVVYLSSFSKVLSPGLRLGFMVAPPELRSKVVLAKQGVDLHTSSLSQHVAERYLASGRLPEQLVRIRSAYRGQYGAMAGALARHFPGGAVSFVPPRGGMFVWAKVEGGHDTAALVDAAVEAGVIYVPGAVFYPERPERDRMRLSFATSNAQTIEAGVGRLAEVFSKVRPAQPSAAR